MGETLAGVPAAAGVAQLLGPDGSTLLIGMAPNLRRWAGARLGLGRPKEKTRRPPTNLRPVAAALRHAETRCAFEQRLVYERLMEEHVPLTRRRDRKTPAYLQLDMSERFPRVVVVEQGQAPAALFGPFRDRRAAAAARDALHKRHPLRPCDYAFEPDPALPLGLACLYAQVRSCAAPCLARVDEDGYRRIALEAATLLGAPSARAGPPREWLPPWVAAARSEALVVERVVPGFLLFPIRGGAVLDEQIREASEDGLERALGELRFEASEPVRDDTPWLLAWLRARRRSGVYLVVEGSAKRSGSALANAVRSAFAAVARGSPAAS